MVAGLTVGTCHTEMSCSWIHLIGKAVDTSFTLVLVQTDIMVIIAIILPGGVIEDIYRMSSRKKSHLPLMGI